MANRLDDYPRVEVQTADALWRWLSEHGARKRGVWLVTYKKRSPHYLPRRQVLEALLAHGWIDSLPRKLDHERTMILVTPRQPGSNWSAVNKAVVAELESMGRMTPAGAAVVERAKKDGSWAALDDVEAPRIPDDLAAALDARPPARERFERFPPSSRRGILAWIASAKQDVTRARRVEQTAQKAAINRKANFPKGRDFGPPIED